MDSLKAMLASTSSMVPLMRQRYEETPQEKAFRESNKFPEFESTMPRLVSRRRASLIDTFTSWLGDKVGETPSPRERKAYHSQNPHHRPVDPENHAVWLFDNTAYRRPGAENDQWEAEFVVAYFIKNSGKDISKVAADIAEKLGIGKGDAAEETIAKRLQPLLDTILPAHTVEVELHSGLVKRMGPSDENGVSSQVVKWQPRIPRTDGSTSVHHAVNIKAATPCTTTFAEPTGWAIISDIDDTIKLTMTSSPKGILETTFAKPFAPIAGMPELYKHINERLSNPPFWYLSASPYNLYPFLRDFREQFYPAGTLILRDASWMNLGGFLASLTQGTQAYKVDRMKKVHGWFPGRKFICIGDSTQSDPESYGDMYRFDPNWVGAIFIRKVTGVAEVDTAKKNDPERFEKAFKDVPRQIWYVFEDPKEVYERIDALFPEGASARTGGT